MNFEPVRYNRARQALMEAKTVDEVKDVRDKAVAMQAYAKQALDPELINLATDIKMRAERMAGEMLKAMKAAGQRVAQGGDRKAKSQAVSLKDLGITPMQSSRWQKLSDLALADFEKRVALAQQHAVAYVDSTPEERTAEKKQRRAAHEAALATQIKGLPTKQYGVILADPEWRFGTWSEEGQDRAAANHYATSTVDQIKARDVPSIAADDCVLALWTTVPMLEQALDVMSTWGFAYKSHCVWLKDKVGTGYWFRNVHEILLIGTKGSPPAPAPGTQWESAFDAAVGEHSEKPMEVYAMLEHYFPNLPKIELNARQKRSGWDCWGAEAPLDVEATS